MVDSNSKAAQMILSKQLRGRPISFYYLDLENNNFGINVGLVDDSNMFVWSVIIEGPKKTLFEVR